MNTSYTEIQKEYTNWLDTLGFSNGLIYDYKFRVRDFLEWLQTQSVNQINQLTDKHINTYFDYLQNRPNKRTKAGLSVSHLNHNFCAIDKLMEFLYQMGMENIPTPTNYRLKVDKQLRINNIEPFSQEEIKTLHANITNTYHPFYLYTKRSQTRAVKTHFCPVLWLRIKKNRGLQLNGK